MERVEKWRTPITEVELEWHTESPWECHKCGARWHRVARKAEAKKVAAKDSSKQEATKELAGKTQKK